MRFNPRFREPRCKLFKIIHIDALIFQIKRDIFSGWWFGCHEFYFPIYWECHHPNWRTHIFQRGGLTTNQFFIFTIAGIHPFVAAGTQRWFHSHVSVVSSHMGQLGTPMRRSSVTWYESGGSSSSWCYPNSWMVKGNPQSKMDDLGVPPLMETLNCWQKEWTSAGWGFWFRLVWSSIQGFFWWKHTGSCGLLNILNWQSLVPVMKLRKFMGH